MNTNNKNPFITVFQWLFFPALVVSGVWLMIASFGGFMDVVKASYTVFFGTIVVCLIVERLLPHKAVWNKRNGSDLRIDATCMAAIFLVLNPIVDVLSPFLMTQIFIHVNQPDGIKLFGFMNEWPLLLQTLTVILLGEFGHYWMHRIAHEVEWIWRFHATHHSAKRIYFLNGYRVHPINFFWVHFASTFPLFLLGVPIVPMVLYMTMAGIMATIQHVNIDLKWGPLNYIFSTNDLHRWHHSIVIKEANKNYGAVFVFWDHIFRTFYYKPNAEPEKLGLSKDRQYPLNSYLKQLLVPFFWKKWVFADTQKNDPLVSETDTV